MDKVARLLDEVAQLGVTFAAESENLRISAPKGALSKELQRRIAESKVEILQRLRQASATGSSRALTRLEPDPAGDSLPFPLSDLQLGFYMADDAYMEFHVRPHYYFEFDWFDLDPAAYEFAWNKALKRHRRELCTVTGNVELKLMTTDIELRCPVYDLRNSSPDQIAARLMAVREEMQRCELPLDRWPWSDIRLSLWIENGRRKGRVHYNHNNFFIDGFGANQLLREVDEYYHNPDLRYPPLALSYRDAVLGLNRLAESEMGRTAHSYWKSRLPGLPPPPDLPQPPGLNRRCRSQLERREGELSKPVWHELKNRAASLGVTPSNAMIAAYAYVIATWSNSDHFI